MYRKFYPRYLLLNICISVIFVAIGMYPEHILLNYWMVVIHWILGIVLMHILIIRLPLFNRFYINRKKLHYSIVQTPIYKHAEYKAAPVMSGLVVFGLVCTVLYVFNMTEFYVEYAFIAGLSTGNMSFYYAP
ncbi:hypothetical protein FHP22_03150 [Acinetobacter indicus]|uniref:Uncharacterized protein n=1 Tax=Acinetobacter indicus TaxID=756892 RepID=A0A6C0Y4M2_9GAMM|nr:hypothetical protein FHP22_03150 [Acinetobacter indicus]QIC71040.1 hypothetical protein FSC09_11790 [Acinetobacter indicus]QIC78171.1 hypothetical protein FSC02_03050 [Acinetobacter indicus]QOW42235.1 hypothetical protein G0027_04830 [Acinetobacter indicus]RVT50707.1 hypothetical protein ENC21_10870 [Acinetobacter indicus]